MIPATTDAAHQGSDCDDDRGRSRRAQHAFHTLIQQCCGCTDALLWTIWTGDPVMTYSCCVLDLLRVALILCVWRHRRNACMFLIFYHYAVNCYIHNGFLSCQPRLSDRIWRDNEVRLYTTRQSISMLHLEKISELYYSAEIEIGWKLQ